MPPSQSLGQGLLLAQRVGYFQTHEEAALCMPSISIAHVWLQAGEDQASLWRDMCIGHLSCSGHHALSPTAETVPSTVVLESSACKCNRHMHQSTMIFDFGQVHLLGSASRWCVGV